MRKGVAYLTYVVGAVVILAMGGTVLYASSGFTQDIGTTVDEGAPTQHESIRQTCLNQQTQVCLRENVRSEIQSGNMQPNEWARAVTVDGKNCWQWAAEDHIFGQDGTADIPSCDIEGIDPVQGDVNCRQAVRQFCFSNPDENWKDSQQENIPESCYDDETLNNLPSCSDYDLDSDGTDDTGATESGDLYINIIDTQIPRQIGEQVILKPSLELDTNAEVVIFSLADTQVTLYDDGEHNDGAANDGVYSNILDIAQHTGQHDAFLLATKETDAGVDDLQTRRLGTIAIDRDYIHPDIQPALDISKTQDTTNIRTHIETNTDARMAFEITYWLNEDQDTSYTITTRPCGPQWCNNVTHAENRFEDEIQEGDTVNAEITVSQANAFPDLEGDTQQISATYQSTPAIVDTYLNAPTGNEVLNNHPWQAELFGVALRNVAPAAVETVQLVEDGTVVAEPEFVRGISDPYIEWSVRNSGYTTLAYTGSVPASELGDTGTEHDIDVQATLQDGTQLTDDLEDVTVVHDSISPALESFRVGYWDSENEILNPQQPGELSAVLKVRENLDNYVQCSINDTEGNRFANCSSTVTPGETDTIRVSLPDEQVDDHFDTFRITLEDTSGNENSYTPSKIIQPDAERLFNEIETHGDPQDKINIVILGDTMSYQEAEQRASRYIDYYFSEQDLAFHDHYRERFNWYIFDTSLTGDLCSDYSRDDDNGIVCPNGIDTIESLVQDSDTFQNTPTTMVILTDSEENPRSYAALSGTKTHAVISSDSASLFAHELGHLLWGFADEYNEEGSNIRMTRAMSTELFNDDIDGFGWRETGDIDKFTNVWLDRDDCEDDVEEHYPDIDPSACTEVQAQENTGYILMTDEKGRSLMWGNNPILYPNHRMRITHLLINSPYTEGSE